MTRFAATVTVILNTLFVWVALVLIFASFFWVAAWVSGATPLELSENLAKSAKCSGYCILAMYVIIGFADMVDTRWRASANPIKPRRNDG